MIPVNDFPRNSVAHVSKTLGILRLAFASGCLMFLGVSVFLIEAEKTVIENSIPSDYFMVGVFAIVIIAAIVRITVTAKRLVAIQDLTSVHEKLKQFRSLMIMNYALIEGPALVSIVAYFLTANRVFLFIAPLIIFQFFLVKIDSESIRQKTGISSMEGNG